MHARPLCNALSIAISLTTASMAAAQDVSNKQRSRSYAIEEVIVTAQKRSESASDIPIAISAFSADNLKNFGINNAKDLTSVVPGFTAAESGGNTPIYTLRGVGFNDTTYTATSTVGVYVDEVSLPYSIMTKGDSIDLERVEVLKGPQGILYGRNTTGGAINFITKKPSDTFEAGVDLSAGRFKTTEMEAYISGPLTDSLKGRVAFKDNRAREGWQESHTRPGDTLGEKEKQTLRAMLEWNATDALFVRLTIDGWRDRSDAQARQVVGIRQQNGADPTGELLLPPQARSYPLIEGDNPQTADWPDTLDWQLNDNFASANLRWDWDLSDRVTFTGIAAQMRVESEGSELPSSGFNYTAFEEVLDAHIETTSLELRLAGSLGSSDSIRWLTGTNYSKDRGFEQHRQLADFQSALFPDPVTGRSTLTNSPEIYGKTLVEQLAGFANIDWDFADEWTLGFGARYTDQSQDYEGCSYVSPQADYDLLSSTFTALSAANAATYLLETGQLGTPSVITQGDCFTLGADGSNSPYTNTLAEDNVSLRLALDWKPGESSMYYVALGRGFKAGGYPVLSASGKEQLEPVVQEELLAVEVGSKLSSEDKQIKLNIAAYYYDYTDKQLLSKQRDPVFGPLPVLQNAPESVVKGLEVDLQYAPQFAPGLFFNFSGAYTETEIKEFIGLDSSGNAYDFEGQPFNFAPKEQATALVSYMHPLTDFIDWSISADYRYSGSTSSSLDNDPAFEHSSYGVWGMRMALDGEQWQVSAFGRNLGDELIPVTILAYGDSISRFTGQPRYYGVGFKYNWQ